MLGYYTVSHNFQHMYACDSNIGPKFNRVTTQPKTQVFDFTAPTTTC